MSEGAEMDLREARAEIARLRAENEALTVECERRHQMLTVSRSIVTRIEAERDVLAARLKDIEKLAWQTDKPYFAIESEIRALLPRV